MPGHSAQSVNRFKEWREHNIWHIFWSFLLAFPLTDEKPEMYFILKIQFAAI